MKLSYRQLISYLSVKPEVEDVCQILTASGLEVEGCEPVSAVPGGLAGLVVGEVITCEKHPDADRLSCTTVDTGTGVHLQIVCGAPNVAAGQKVVVAPVDTTVYPVSGEPFKIKKSKIRGALSEGMICAEDEIGLGTSHDGIMILSADAPVGTPVKDFLNLGDDYQLEVNLTPNRPDAASHIGSARDVAAWLSVHRSPAAVRMPDVSSFPEIKVPCPVELRIEAESDCRRYSGILLSGIHVAESPEWLKKALSVIGLRPVNSVVDITNYVLHETGQPLHAFDAAKIKGSQVVVRHAGKDSECITLDGQKRSLEPSDLLICDAEKPMCIAGVFGGLESGVSTETTSVFLESAWFYPSSVRRTSKRLGLKTDASFRFERGTDPEMTLYALKRAALLMQEICGAQILTAPVDVYPEKFNEKIILLRKAKIQQVTGIEIPNQTVTAVLSALGIKILSEDSHSFSVQVSHAKVDVTREIDLIEEIIRIYGIDRIPAGGILNYRPDARRDDAGRSVYTSVAQLLVNRGFSEILTHSLSHSAFYPDNQTQLVKVLNPISSELDILRNEMVFSGLQVLAHNRNRQMKDQKLFELGKVYQMNPDEKPTVDNPLAPYSERFVLGVWISGSVSPESWNNKSTDVDYYYLKSVADSLLMDVKTKMGLQVKPHTDAVLSGAAYFDRQGRCIGRAGEVHPTLLKAAGLKQSVCYFELEWDIFKKARKSISVSFKELPKYPSVRRDLALLADVSVTYAALEQAALKAAGSLLREVNLFDVYEGKNLPEGKKSYALSYVFRDDDKTLTDEKTDELIKKILTVYEKDFPVSLR